MKNFVKRSSLILIGLLSGSFLSGEGVTTIAQNNATIQAGGSTANPWFHNAQSSGNFISYAIASFSPDASEFPNLSQARGIQKMEISYTQALAPFTQEGPIEFFITFDPVVGAGDFSKLQHTGSENGINNDHFADEPTRQSLGKQTFRPRLEGEVDTFTLRPNSAVSEKIIQSLRSGTPFSIILTAPAEAGQRTAATYAGIENRSHPNQILLNLQLSNR